MAGHRHAYLSLEFSETATLARAACILRSDDDRDSSNVRHLPEGEHRVVASLAAHPGPAFTTGARLAGCGPDGSRRLGVAA